MVTLQKGSVLVLDWCYKAIGNGEQFYLKVLTELCVTKWNDKPKSYDCLCKKFWLGEQWRSDIAVSRNLAKQSNVLSENTGCETLLFSPLLRMSINVADSSLLPLLFLTSQNILSGCPIINTCGCHQDLNCCEFDPWHIIHVIGFITPYLLHICLMIMAALAMFQALIRVGVVIGKFLIDLGVRNILDTRITWSGNILVSVRLAVCLFHWTRVMDWML